MKEQVTVIFDAAGGGITVSNKRVVKGEPYGELPTPSRFGYEFDGWFTDEVGGELVDADTVVTAEFSHPLYAHWTKNDYVDPKLEAYKRKKASSKQLKIIMIIAALLAVLAIAGLCVVSYFVNRTTLEDVDGTLYKIVKKGDTYILCNEDEVKLPMTEDGKYYLTAANSQVKLDEKTGVASIYAYVDTAGHEVVGNIVTARILAFPQLERADIAKIEVVNDKGGFTVIGKHADSNKDGKIEHTFYLQGHKDTALAPEPLSSLIVSCGYPLAVRKIDEPIADANGQYTEYGLAPETRTDAEGNSYEYTPASYCITSIYGEEFRVIVGDPIVSGAGYYIQYLNSERPGEPFIYIVGTTIANTVLQAKEAMVQPLIVYPMTTANYYNVENFAYASVYSDITVEFSFVPLQERLGTQNASTPYVFHNEEFKFFRASSGALDYAINCFTDMTINSVIKIAPDDEALITYGVAMPDYMISFDFISEEGRVKNLLYVSEMTERGTYYIYSALYDMIVEVDRSQIAFLEFRDIDWLDSAPYNINIACTDDIYLAADGKTVKFELDNSDSEQFAYTKISKSSYTATNLDGKKTTYSLAKDGGKYVIKAEGTEPLSVYAEDMQYLLTSDGKLFLIEDTSRSNLTLTGTTGRGTLYVTGYDKSTDCVLHLFVDEKTGEWGRIERTLDSKALRVYAQVGGENEKQINLEYFRHFFQTILYASLEGVCTLTEEEMAALRATPDSEAQLVLRMTTEDGEIEFKFYQYSERRSYITINGDGQFFILSDRVEKILNDALKIINGEDVVATDKN